LRFYLFIDRTHNCADARLNGENSWTPDPMKMTGEDATFLQVDFLAKNDQRSAGYRIHGIGTQGDPKFGAWVTKVWFSNAKI
jgi:hypothetical protein